MQEIIASILDAEGKAEEIIKNASEKAKEIKRTADDDGEKIKNGAVAIFKLHRASDLKNAEKKADAEYDKILAQGQAEAEKISESASDSIDRLADEIVKSITD